MSTYLTIDRVISRWNEAISYINNVKLPSAEPLYSETLKHARNVVEALQKRDLLKASNEALKTFSLYAYSALLHVGFTRFCHDLKELPRAPLLIDIDPEQLPLQLRDEIMKQIVYDRAFSIAWIARTLIEEGFVPKSYRSYLNEAMFSWLVAVSSHKESVEKALDELDRVLKELRERRAIARYSYSLSMMYDAPNRNVANFEIVFGRIEGAGFKDFKTVLQELGFNVAMRQLLDMEVCDAWKMIDRVVLKLDCDSSGFGVIRAYLAEERVPEIPVDIESETRIGPFVLRPHPTFRKPEVVDVDTLKGSITVVGKISSNADGSTRIDIAIPFAQLAQYLGLGEGAKIVVEIDRRARMLYIRRSITNTSI